MASAADRGRAAATVGERGVSVAGDVTGSVIVTGDHNDIKLLLGSEHGALIERLSRSARPTKQLRPAPLGNLPDRPADSIDRDQDALAVATSGVAPAKALNLHGEAAIGKTYVLLRAVEDPQSPIAAEAVYVYAAGGLDDVLQAVFDAFYEQVPRPDRLRHSCEMTWPPSAPR
jgi:hypothetical protein